MHEQVVNALKKGATIVTATRRLARILHQEYNALQLAGGLKAWESPKILTWSAWMNDLWQEFLFINENPQVLLKPWQELILWEQVIRNSPESGELLQVHATASAAQEAWRLAAEWRLDMAQVEALGNEDARAFVAWAGRFQEICEGKGWIEYARSVDILRSALNRLPLPSGILLAGFDEFTPQQREFLAASSKAGCSATKLNATASQPDNGIIRVPFPDAEREIEAAARWARALLETGVAGKIGVVVAGLASRRNLVERVFRCYLEPAAQLPGERPSSKLINLSAGNSLAYYPMIQSALAILSLSPEMNEWRSISSLLASPFIRGADTERISRALLDARMRRDCGSEIPISYLRRLSREQEPRCPLLDSALGNWLKTRSPLPRAQTAGQWSRSFSSMLEAFGWPGERALNSAEFQTMQAWTELLSDFASTDLTSGSIPIGEAVSLVQRIAGQIMFQPENEEAAVQILGALEASGLFFDRLWIAGLHDEAWPGPANPNPFLPARLQREKGIPRCCPERELEFTALITRRLLASGSNVMISYPVRAEDRELGPSPLIASIPSAAPGDLNLLNGDSIQETIRQSRSVEKLVDGKGPPLVESSRQRGGTKVFQYQAGCPFRAFAELRLGAEKLEFPVPGLDPRQRGILVHSALEEIWKQLRTHSALCFAKDLPEAIRRSIETAIVRFEQERGSALPPRFADLERERLQRLLSDWLEFEKKREPFEVVQPEGERFAEVSGIRFKVKIDRIDCLSDGREVIIDYKTGEPNARSWETDRPDEPQLPLYSTIHEKPLAGVLFAQIKPGKLRFLGFVDNNVSIPGGVPVELSARIKEWRSILEKLGSDFRAGHAEVDPKDPRIQCRYCPQPCFCRISESKTRLKEEEAV